MNVFPAGTVKTAIARVDVDPAGIECTAELWLSKDGASKDASSGSVSFTSTGNLQDVPFSVTMPAGGYNYGVYLDIMVGGVIVGEYMATEGVIVPSVSEPIITW